MSRISSAERARLSPRERARRKRIASEKMALRLEHEEVFKLVKRMKLTVGDLNNLFDADVWYIKDESSGDVFWPEQWQQELQPHTEKNPWKYFMVERDRFPPFDQAYDPELYDGEVQIWCENVPVEVEAGSLICWLRAGLESRLPHIQRAREKTAELKLKFLAAENETNDIAKQPAADEEEENFKAVRLEKLQKVQDKHEDRYLRAKAIFDEHVSNLRAEPIQATPLIRSRDNDKALWQLNFSRRDRADFVLQAMDGKAWDAVRLSQPADAPPRCLQPRLEDGAMDPRSNFPDEVVMRGACFKRFRHGRGRERNARVQQQTTTTTRRRHEAEEEEGEEDDGEEDEAPGEPGEGVKNVHFQYEGGFAYGQRHGEDSTTVTFYYTLLGDHYNGTPVKAHELRYANGDCYRGELAPTYRHGGHPTHDLWTPYGDGAHDDRYEKVRYDNGPVPHGLGAMDFADGSRYEGEWKCGRICGRGAYRGAAGDVVEGDFADGVLQGDGRVDHGGLQAVGTFKRGQLHGGGVKLFGDRNLHDGHFERGELQRFGRFVTPKLRFRGWVRHDSPAGHGVATFGEARRVYSKAAGGTVELPQYECHGHWMGDSAPEGRRSCVHTRRFPSSTSAASSDAAPAGGRSGGGSGGEAVEASAHPQHPQQLQAGGSTQQKEEKKNQTTTTTTKKKKQQQLQGREASIRAAAPLPPAAVAFAFQCPEVKRLGRRLQKEGARAGQCVQQWQATRAGVRRRFNRKVRSKNHDRFLASVSRILLADEFDQYFGESDGSAGGLLGD